MAMLRAIHADEEVAEILVNLPELQYRLRDWCNPYDILNEVDFKKRFRLSKDTSLFVCELLRADLQRPTTRSRAIPVHIQVLTALEFFARGAHQQLHSENRSVSQASVSRIVRDVSMALAEKRGQFIKFSAENEVHQEAAADFYEYSNFPGVIGAIDCTHVPIRNPGGNNALYFINKKNTSSVNVQVVCNMRREITNIVARWPGGTHDSRIFTNSLLKQKLEDIEDDSTWLVGDSGYACLPYLMTPLLRPVGHAQQRYNMAHKRARNIIERLFGMMKRRFPCLNLLRVRLDTALAVIVACGVLWNISIAHGDDDFGFDANEDEDQPQPGVNNNVAARAGQLRRERLIQDHFA